LLQAETEPDDLSIDADDGQDGVAAATAPAALYPDLDERIDMHDDDDDDPAVTAAADQAAAAAPSTDDPASPLLSSNGSGGGTDDDGRQLYPTAPPINAEDSLTSDDTASARSTEL